MDYEWLSGDADVAVGYPIGTSSVSNVASHASVSPAQQHRGPSILPEAGASAAATASPLSYQAQLGEPSNSPEEEISTYAGPSSSPQQQLPESPVSPDTVDLLLAKTGRVSDGWVSQTLFSQQIPVTTTSPRFWDAPLISEAGASAAATASPLSYQAQLGEPSNSPEEEISTYAGPSSSPQQQLPESPVSPDTVDLLLAKTGRVSDGWVSQTLFSQQIPVTTTSPRFWDAPLISPAISVVEIDGEEIISISPGPDDKVDVIVQLKQAPVAVIRARVKEAWSIDATTRARLVREHKQEVLDSHTAALEAMAERKLPFEPKHYYTHILNGIAGSIRMAELPALASLPQVGNVHLDYQVQITLVIACPL